MLPIVTTAGNKASATGQQTPQLMREPPSPLPSPPPSPVHTADQYRFLVYYNKCLVWYAPHKQGAARPMARHPLPPRFKNIECAQTTLPCS